MKKGLIIFFLPMVVLLAAGEASAQEPRLYGNFENWDVFLTNTAAGEFDFCMATRNYPSEEMLIFYTDGQTFTMGLLLERWQLDARESYNVSIQVDNGAPVATQALAGDDKKSVYLELELSPYMMDFVRGSEFFLNTDAGSLKFNIDGADVALNSMATCALENMPPEAP